MFEPSNAWALDLIKTHCKQKMSLNMMNESQSVNVIELVDYLLY